MPYRIDIAAPPSDALDRLVQMGALDLEPAGEGLAAILPDDVKPDAVARALRCTGIRVSAADARDNQSVWLLSPRSVRIGGLLIAPPHVAASPNTLRLVDSAAFGSGHHPTTALCVEALAQISAFQPCDSILDVGTGSGILALAALLLGVPEAVGVDIDSDALQAAVGNARLNQFDHRVRFVRGGPEAVDGNWPLVVANVLAAPLIEMAPVLVRRLKSQGRLILSGIPWSLEPEVRRAYRHLGVRHLSSKTRAGWTVLVAQASW